MNMESDILDDPERMKREPDGLMDEISEKEEFVSVK